MRTKKCFFVILSSLLIVASFPLSAFSKDTSQEEASDTGIEAGSYSTKDEVIYGNLDTNGQPKNLYVVNSFHITEPGEIIDFGSYIDVRNLTDLSNIENATNEVHFHADEQEFFYQGKLESKPLPWTTSITYVLNGEEMNANELAGQSGDFEIQIDLKANKHVDPLFFEYYLLQISLTLDPAIFQNIQAPKGTEANVGKDKQLTFSAMPEQEDVFIMTAHVENFALDPIEITAIPANIAIENPDIDHMTDDMSSLANAIKDIDSGVAKLSSGTTNLKQGTLELSKGSREYRQGMNELNHSSNELTSGSKEFLNALRQISGAVKEAPDQSNLADLKTLPKEFRELAHELRNFSKGIAHLDQAISSIPHAVNGEDIEQIRNALKKSNADEHLIETVNQLERTYYAAQATKEMSQGMSADTIEHTNTIANYLDMIANRIEESMGSLEGLDDLVELQKSLSTLASEYKSFHTGLVSYTEGINTLATSYTKLDQGVQELSGGISELDRGVKELHNGTNELQQSTSDLPNQMQLELEKFMEEFDFSDFKPISFVSDENKNVNVVQFVLKTERIEMEDPEEIVGEEEEEKGFWDRFLDLFR